MTSLPSSATPEIFLSRVQFLQRYAASITAARVVARVGENEAKNAADTLNSSASSKQDVTDDQTMILILAGSDGLNSSGASSLLKYLFSFSPLDTLSSSTSLPDSFDSLVIGVSEHGVKVVAHTREVAEVMREVTKLVEGVEIWTRGSGASATKAESTSATPAEEEEDENELFKIHSFISIVKNVKHILVPLTDEELQPPPIAPSKSKRAPPTAEESLRTLIESYPLIQAYGLDELGANGFFTLSHEVSPFKIDTILKPELSKVDASYLEYLIQSRVGKMEYEMKEVVRKLMEESMIGFSNDGSSSHAQTVAQVNTDLKNVWLYGCDTLSNEEKLFRTGSSSASSSSSSSSSPPPSTFEPSISFYNSTGSAQTTSSKLIRESGSRHYSTLSQYYTMKVLSVYPYFPVAQLATHFAARSSSPLHCVVRLTDSISMISCVRTILLAQVNTTEQDGLLQALDTLVPSEWKKKKKVIVKDEEEDDGEASESSKKSIGSDEEEDEDDEDEDEYSQSDDEDNDEERKTPLKSKSVTKSKPLAPAKPTITLESPGSRDALLLHVVYQILVQETLELLGGVNNENQFPSFGQIHLRVVKRLEVLKNKKWLNPQYYDVLKEQKYNDEGKKKILEIQLCKIDAFGHITKCELEKTYDLFTASSTSIYSLTLSLHFLPSRELLSLTEDDVLLGSVAFGETFVGNKACGSGDSSKTTNLKKNVTAEDDDEEKRRKADPFYGTGMTSSAASNQLVNTSAAAVSSSASSPLLSPSSRILLLTSTLPSSIILPSFFQYYTSALIHAILASMVHAGYSPSANLGSIGDSDGSSSTAVEKSVPLTRAEILLRGFLPSHESLGQVIYDAYLPKLSTEALMTPPTTLSQGAVGVRCGAGGNSLKLPLFVSHRYDRALPVLALPRDHSFLSVSPLSTPVTILTSSATTPVLQGNLLLFEQGFVFTSMQGVFVVEFSKCVLEAAWFDGKDWKQAMQDGSAPVVDEDDDDEDGSDEDYFDDTDGDGLYTFDLLSPPAATSVSSTPSSSSSSPLPTPYSFLLSLDTCTPSRLAESDPTKNTGVQPAKSKFAQACFKLAIVVPAANANSTSASSQSSFRRSFFSHIQSTWQRTMEDGNIHNDFIEEVPEWCKGGYKMLQEEKRGIVKKEKEETLVSEITNEYLYQLKLDEQFRVHSDSASSMEEARQALELLRGPPTSSVAGVKSPSTTTAVSVPISLLLGTPGSAHSEVLTSIQQKSSDEWIEVVLCANDKGVVEKDVLEKRLKDAIATVAMNKQVNTRILLAISSFDNVFSTIAFIEKVLRSSSPTAHIASSTLLLSSAAFFLDPAHSLTYPNARDSILAASHGFVNGVILMVPQQNAGSDSTLTQAVRSALRNSFGSKKVPLLVGIQGKRLMHSDVSEMIGEGRYNTRAQRVRRAEYVLSHTKVQSISSSTTNKVTRHFLTLPGSILLDRTRFFNALTQFMLKREVYRTESEKEEERKEAEERVRAMMENGKDAISAASLIPSSSSTTHNNANRITFTTSSTSLPSSYTPLLLQAYLKFSDAISESGGCSDRYFEVRAEVGGRVSVKERRVSCSQLSEKIGEKEVNKKEKEQKKEDEEDNELLDLASPRPTSSTIDPNLSLPLEQLPPELRTCIAETSAHHTLSSTSCLLLIYGSSALKRSDVAVDLLLTSMKQERTYEKSQSMWNRSVKEQREWLGKM